MWTDAILKLTYCRNKRKQFFGTLQECLSVKSISYDTVIDRFFFRSKEHKKVCACLHETLKQNELGNFKYNGRYVFVSVFGCYEFFSVLFSLLSFLVCLIKYKKFLKSKKIMNLNTSLNIPEDYKLKIRDEIINEDLEHFSVLDNSLEEKNNRISNTKIYFFLSGMTYFSSIMMHTHENKYTQRADYFSAMLSIIYTSILFSEKSLQMLNFPKNIYKIYSSTSFGAFSYVLYDQYYNDNFDPVINKSLSSFFITVLLFNFIFHHISQDCIKKKYHISRVAGCMLMCIFFECIDMPPIFFLLDSHALWHFCLIFFYYHICEYLILNKYN